jgi:hypothetical protein
MMKLFKLYFFKAIKIYIKNASTLILIFQLGHGQN